MQQVRRLCLGATVILATACGIPDIEARPPSVADAEGIDSAALCQASKPQETPLIVEWPGTHKVELESISKHGLVVVAYSGCSLKVLPLCEAKGTYTFESVSPQRDLLELKDTNDLFSKLPVGAQALKAEMSSGQQFKLDYVLVGRRGTKDSPTALSGDCQGATHFVRAISVGAYDLSSSAKAAGGADVDIGIFQAGGSRKSERARNRASGNVSGCSDKTDLDETGARSAGCSAPVQLTLMPMPGK